MEQTRPWLEDEKRSGPGIRNYWENIRGQLIHDGRKDTIVVIIGDDIQQWNSYLYAIKDSDEKNKINEQWKTTIYTVGREGYKDEEEYYTVRLKMPLDGYYT